jgi:hypothetical protein
MTNHLGRRVVSWSTSLLAVAIFCCSAIIPNVVSAQILDCPPLRQLVDKNGTTLAPPQSNAAVTVYVVGSLGAQGTPPFETAMAHWAQGSQMTYTVQVVSTVPSGSASAATPAHIFQFGGTEFFCSDTPQACTVSQNDSQGRTITAITYIDPNQLQPFMAGFTALMDHEIGHGLFGIADCKGCADTIMNPDINPYGFAGLTLCDEQYLYVETDGAYGTPPVPDIGECTPMLPPECIRCAQWSLDGCLCEYCWGYGTPILVNIGNTSEVKLSSPDNGVQFDLNASGVAHQTAWTRANDSVGFLSLDRNGNGMIDSGAELFGNFTPIPGGTARHGLEALAVFDDSAFGGNGDGFIDENDAVWPNLRIWVDQNHNGHSEEDELLTLEDAGITSISLALELESRKDTYGNLFRYRVRFQFGSRTKWGYDVFLKETVTLDRLSQQLDSQTVLQGFQDSSPRPGACSPERDVTRMRSFASE